MKKNTYENKELMGFQHRGKIFAEYKRITTKRNHSQVGKPKTNRSESHHSLFFHSLRSNLAEQRPTDLSKDMKAIVSKQKKKNYVGMEFAFRTTGSFIRYATSRRASSVFSHTIFPSGEANTTPPELL